MRKTKKNSSIILIIMLLVSILTGCGRKPEAVITVDGEDITEEATEYATMEESSASKFSYDDLVVGNLKYMMTEEEVKALIGEPVSMYESKETNQNGEQVQYAEHVLSYNELTLIFMPFDGVYKLTAAASVSANDQFARGIKVGDQLEDILKLFYRDSNAMNNNYLANDQSTVLGKYLYGNFTIDDLETLKTSDAINYGVINYAGFLTMENAETYYVEFTSFDEQYKDKTATTDDDFAQLTFDMDNTGIITGIRWYYYPEVDN